MWFARLSLVSLIALFATGAAAEPDGRYLYVLTCSGCHGTQGAASEEGRIPALAGSIGHYMKTPQARQFLPQAPGIMSSGLKDEQVTALMNWMVPALAGESLAAPFKPYSVDEIAGSRASKPADFFARRRAIAAELEALGAKVSPY
jgi:mono/diheme cytochrome c family protein